VTGYDTIMPLAKMEKYYMPSVEQIITAVNNVMEF
jgi:2-oxoisovalerate dehydrogenase E1 component beta subunit